LGKHWRKCHIGARQRQCHFEGKQHRPQFDEKYSKCVDKMKQAKLQWLQDPSQTKVIFKMSDMKLVDI
jgi:hypothetical protein